MLEYAPFNVCMSVDFACMSVCLKQQQTDAVRGKGKLQ